MEYNKVNQNINNIVNEQVRKLESIFPSAVKDGEVDFEALREELGQFQEVDNEKYELTWSGKKNAKKIAQEDVAGRTLKFIPEDSKDVDTTENLYIEGDNLEVLKLLRQNYYGAIKMIYIDPPYNTGGDFLYNDSFTASKKILDINEGNSNELGERYTINKDSQNRYHTNWLNMIYPRLKCARELLQDNGIILINIDENEVTNLQKICIEIFGEQNDLGTIIWDKRNPKGDSRGISYQHEYILVYAKNKVCFFNECSMQRPKKNARVMINKAKKIFSKIGDNYTLQDANSEFAKWINKQQDLSGGEKAYCKMDNQGRLYRGVSMAWPNKKMAPEDYFVPLVHPKTGKKCPIPERGWRNPSSTMKELLNKDLIIFGEDETTQPTRKYLLEENMYENIPSLIYYGGSDSAMLDKLGVPFDTPKVVEICKEHIRSFTKDNDIILDFFSGSCTTAHAVMEVNQNDDCKCKYIMVQIPESCPENSIAYKSGYKNICEIGKERICRAGEKIKEEHPDTNIDIGFKVFRTADTNIKWNSLMDMGQIDIEQMETSPDTIDFMPGAKDIDIVYELMLRQKDIPLSSKIERLFGGRSRTYLYADSYLVCLETKISTELINKLAEIDPLPVKFIFRDSAFQDDISLKDETFRRLRALIEKNAGTNKPAYTVEFI